MSRTAMYTVNGMTCGGCVKKVRSAISGIDGVTDVEVQFKTREVTVTSDAALDEQTVTAAVEAAGYEVAT